MILLSAVYIGLTGMVIASFLNVAASGKGTILQNIKRKRSQCESCGKELMWWELIPVLSWFLLRGKCSKCKKNISVFHPVSEIVLGSMFAVTFCHIYNNTCSNNWLFVGIGLAVIVLYFFSVMDIFHGIVPNKQVYPVIIVMMWVRVVLSVKSPTPLYELLNYALAAAVYFSFFGVINFLSTRGLMPGVSGKKQGFGWGDAKYALLLGLLLGVRSMFVAMWVSIFAGGFISVILFLRSRNRNMAIPYVPFMSIGAWIAMLWGSEIADTVLRLLLI